MHIFQELRSMTRRALLRTGLALLGLSLLWPSSVRATEPSQDLKQESKTVRLLTVGNSFSANATRFLGDLSKAGGHTLIHQPIVVGGASLELHAGRFALHEKDAQDPAGLYGKRSLKDYLGEQPWDFITIQQASIKSHDPATYRPYAKQLQDFIKQHAPRAEVLMHQTWAYRQDDPRFAVAQPKPGEPTSHAEMYGQLTAAYSTIAGELGIRRIPVGDAFFLADTHAQWGYKPDAQYDFKQANPITLPDQAHSLHVGWKLSKQADGTQKLSIDGHHANTAGEYLGACVWYEVLFNESVIGNEFIAPSLDKLYATFLQETAHQAVVAMQTKSASTALVNQKVEEAHAEIWRRFVDQHGILLDFTDLDGKVNYPTPEECRLGKPNALGWWSPIENGAMFNGLYMDAAILRWKYSRSDADATQARRLMEGLLKLNEISNVKGFVGRGLSTDGKSHYPMGSNDQTLPWLVGLWRYWESDLATANEKDRIKQHLVETVNEIERLGWKMPAEAPFGSRGSFNGFHFDEVARLLFTAKLMHVLTGDEKWQSFYRQELERRGGEHNRTKREICEVGMAFFYAKTHNWTSCTAVSALRGLWELENDAALKAIYARGLIASAKLAAESLPLAMQFDPQDSSVFLQDWRASMLPQWKPQQTEVEASKLAEQQLREFMKTSPRRQRETAFIREPTSAAWIVTLCPDREVVQSHQAAIEQVLGRYDYSRLYYSTFFWVEAAWWRMNSAP